MHKCPKCKAEFEGKFCPECGTEWINKKICPRCGATSGMAMKFCSECGYRFEVEEKACPQCGTKFNGSARFCEECGYSFTEENNGSNGVTPTERHNVKQYSAPYEPKVRNQKIKVEDRPSTLFSIIKYVPILLLMVFSILMLIFFSVNVAMMPGTTIMGMPVSAQPYGSIYGDVLENLPEIKGVVIALIIFASLTLAYTILCVLISVLHKTKNYRVLFLGKYDILLSEMLSILSPIIYALFIVLSSVLMGKLSSLDGGSGLIETAAYSKLVLAFSIIFFVVSLGASVLRIVKYTEFLTQGGSMSAGRKAELAEFYETHEPPVVPRKVEKPIADKQNGVSVSYDEQMLAYSKYKKEAEGYKFDKHRYDNGKEGRAAAGVVWLSLNKVKITVFAVIISIIVILLSTLIPYFANIFRVGKVEDIKLGMSQEQVLDILGDPYDKKELNKSNLDEILSGGSGIIDSVASGGNSQSKLAVTRWRYYDKEYAKMRKEAETQLETIGFKGGVDGIISGSLGGLTGVASSMATVLTSLFNKTYDYIQVDFDENERVVKVILEKSRCDGVSNKKRDVDKMIFSDSESNNGPNSDKTFYYYEDFTGDGNSAAIVTKERQGWYTTYFDGGSFIRSYIEDFSFNQFANDNKEKVKGSWKDDYAEYSVTQNAKRIGMINVEHEWVNEGDELTNIDFLPNSVTAISDDAFKGLKIESVVIPDSVTAIGNSAFSGCEKLLKVVMGKNLLNIGQNAFLGCKGLRYIDIPYDVNSIGANAFKDCELLAIHCEANYIPNGWDSDWNSDGYTVYTRCKTVNGINYALKYNSDYKLEAVVVIQDKEIEKAEIPDTVDYSGFISFYNVAEIAPQAFYDCSRLTSIDIPNSVTVIGSQAFNGCTELINIYIPNSIEEIGKNAFVDCSSLQYNEYNGGVYLGSEDNPFIAFIALKDKTSVSYKINEKTTIIAHGALDGCDKLVMIEIPEGVIDLHVDLFADCENLSSIIISEDNSKYSSQSGILYNKEKTEILFVPKSMSGSIIIPNGLTNIGDNAFENCVGLTNIQLPDSLLSIGDRAFSGCSGLTSIEIPESVISIGEQAFQGCNSLNYIVIPSSVISIENYAFRNNGNITLFCEADSKLVGWDDDWSINNHIVWACTKDYEYAVIDSVCFALKDNEAKVISQNPNIRELHIPANVTFKGIIYRIMSIEAGALNGCSNLASITLPFVGSGETEINASSNTLFGYIFGTSSYYGGSSTTQYYSNGNSTYYIPTSLKNVTITGGNILYGAFYGCNNLMNIKIPNSVKNIDDRVFYNCSSLTSIEIPNSVTSIGVSAFYGCKNLTSIEIPNSVVNIGNSAFYGCNKLTSIEIPNSVVNIENSAFYGCNNLVSIYYLGDVSNWCGISGLGNLMAGSRTLYINGKVLTGELILSRSVTVIEDYAFYNCSDLTSIEISNSVASIGERAFAFCSGLTCITVGSGVRSIGYAAFDNCYNIESVYYTGDIAGWCNINFVIYSYYPSSNPVIYSHKLYIDNKLVTEVVVPNAVTRIYPSAFMGCDDLVSVKLGSNVTEIGAYAFNNCVSLESVIIPDSVDTIGRDAFYGCKKLSSIRIPNKVSVIREYTFEYCSSLSSIVIGENVSSIGDSAFYGCTKLMEIYNLSELDIIAGSKDYGYVGYYAAVIYNNLNDESKLTTTADGYVFYSNDNKTYLVGYSGSSKYLSLPSTYNGGNYEIYKFAFLDCDDVVSITIPNNVENIGEGAFDGCLSLQYKEYDNALYLGNSSNPYLVLVKAKNEMITNCNIHSDTKIIYYHAFYDCDQLETISIPNKVTVIGYGAFSFCNSLRQISISSSLREIDDYAFAGTIISDITVPNGVLSIGDNAFYDCRSLVSVTIPNSVTKIGDSAFNNCTSLTSVSLGTGISEISNRLFYQCRALINFNIPNKVKSIGYGAFYDCRSLTSITIPDGVESIGNSAFSSCNSLQSITIPNSILTIGSYVFNYCSKLTTVYLGNNVISIGEYAFSSCSALTGVYYAGTIADWCNIDFGDSGTGYGNTSNPLYYAHNLYIDNKLVTELIIPEEISVISNDAFIGCSHLTSITIHRGVTSIGRNAFEGCFGITSVYWNAINCTYLGSWSSPLFEDCTNLKTVIFGEQVTSIPRDSFTGCTGLTSIVIPKSVTSIGTWAFKDCTNLVSVEFKDIQNWQYDGNNLYLSSDKARNAQYLTTTYTGYTWKKK